MRRPSVVGVSALINPLAVPPDVCVGEPHEMAEAPVLLCAWALPTPPTASIVATEIGSNLKYFIIVRVVLIQVFPEDRQDRLKSSRVRVFCRAERFDPR